MDPYAHFYAHVAPEFELPSPERGTHLDASTEKKRQVSVPTMKNKRAPKQFQRTPTKGPRKCENILDNRCSKKLKYDDTDDQQYIWSSSDDFVPEIVDRVPDKNEEDIIKAQVPKENLAFRNDEVKNIREGVIRSTYTDIYHDANQPSDTRGLETLCNKLKETICLDMQSRHEERDILEPLRAKCCDLITSHYCIHKGHVFFNLEVVLLHAL